MVALAAAVYLIWYFDPSASYTVLLKEQNPNKYGDLNLVKPAEIIEYVKWNDDSACAFYQGKFYEASYLFQNLHFS